MDLPDELAGEEGIPEALNALRQAMTDPDVLALIAHREKFLADEKKRFARVTMVEHRKAFRKAVHRCLTRMKAMGLEETIIAELKKKAHRHGKTL